MTFEGIDARHRSAELSGDAEDGWDDPELTDDDDDADELGYRDADEEATYDEQGDQNPDEAA